MNTRLKPILAVSFAVYGLLMLWLLFMRNRLEFDHTGDYLLSLQANPYPFQTIVYFVKILITGHPSHLIVHAWRNLVGNVVMFVPLGFFLSYFCKPCRTYKVLFGVGLLIIASIELGQFFTLLGSLDFDDFLLNMLGISLGFAVWKCLHAKCGDVF